MPSVIVVLALFTALIAADADAETDVELLAEMFSPILILVEANSENPSDWGPLSVIKPEPVEIMGAESSGNIWFELFTADGTPVASNRLSSLIESGVLDTNDVKRNQESWFPEPEKRVDLLGGEFAFFDAISETTYRVYSGSEGSLDLGIYPVKIYLNYPGEGATEWDETYFGYGDGYNDPQRGSEFPNTAYVHTYRRTIEQYQATYDSVTVVQYFYFYPYNDWWNNHEGAWPRVDVVVSSSDPSTAQVQGDCIIS